MEAYEYDATSAVGTATTIGAYFSSGSGNNNLLGTVYLPIPSNIQDGNSVSYGEDKLNTFTANVVGIAQGAMTADILEKGLSSLTPYFQQASNLIQNKNLQNIVTKSLAAEAVSIFGGNVSIDSLLAREQGTILNPNMELLFNGVTLRTFRFSFKLTPRDNDESDNIKYIIWFLKKNMAAKGGRGEDFLKTPNIFKLKYKKGSDDHPFLHKFKDCFLKDMSVNYTGENVYATYSDGTPVSMIMDLTFQELFPIYDGDYADSFSPNQNGVGY